MSYICLVTANFDAVVHFYRDRLSFPVIGEWERAGARGVVLDLYGLRVEILDAMRERQPLNLHPPGDRVHLVIEVPDVDAVFQSLALDVSEPTTATWGARWFAVRDPDGIALSFLEWLPAGKP